MPPPENGEKGALRFEKINILKLFSFSALLVLAVLAIETQIITKAIQNPL